MFITVGLCRMARENKRGLAGRLQKSTRLRRGQPIPESHAQFLYTLHTSIPCRGLVAEQPQVFHLLCRVPDADLPSICDA
jgi:hypothetical protein